MNNSNKFGLSDSLIAAVNAIVNEKKLDPVGKADPDIDNDGDVDKSDKYLHNRRKAISKNMGDDKKKTLMGGKDPIEVDPKLKEEVEEIDELSKKTLGSYIKKASQSAAMSAADYGKNVRGDTKDTGKMIAKKNAADKASKRLRGIEKATGRLTKEESEIDELSKGTMKSYVKKALDTNNEKSVSNLASRGGYELGNSPDDDFEAGHKYDRKAVTRSKGIQRAVNKLTKEEVEQVDEREISPAETRKKEEIVKSMKKGTAGFKKRYGERWKEVMYATATKMAMKKEEVSVEEASELPKDVISKAHKIAKALIRKKVGVREPYAVGMATAKKEAGRK